MTKRQGFIIAAQIAGYHQDIKTFTRLVIESRVSRPFLDKAWHAGRRAKEQGILCHCLDCQPKGV